MLAPAAGLWLFVSLAGEVNEGETTGFDKTILLVFRRPDDLAVPLGPRWLQETARDITALGGFTVLTLLALFAVTILLMHGRRLQALVFAVTVVAAQVAAESIKTFVGRLRPDLVPQHDIVYSASFPSGHSMMAPVVYLTLAAILAAGEHRRSVKVLLMVTAVVLVIAIGLSRIYLGVHWPTDVLAGWSLGSAIAVAASLVLHRAAPRPLNAAEIGPDTPGTP